jgi:hypothetical protein
MNLARKLLAGLSARIRVVLMAMMAVAAIKLGSHATMPSGNEGSAPGGSARIALEQPGL